jgi:flagellar M-ring protein FliF
MRSFTDSVKEFFAPLNPAQRTMFVGMVIAVAVLVGFVFYWALKPSYSLLFGSLDTKSAQEIIEQLDERQIEYKIENNGTSIYVPSEKVHELRIHLASDGLAQSSVKGYELFDANALGMTDFMQQVNRKRALEGELSRSINSLEQVESSRVHLVLPERSPFEESTVEASASVILNLKPGRKLAKEQVRGITALIEGSVQGLEASAITVLDQSGNRLTNELSSHSDFASGTLQMQLRKKTESYLTERGQTMLDRVLGPGNSILRVSVEHNFDRLVRESDIINPDSRMVISEESKRNVHTDEASQLVPIDEFTPVNERGETVVVSTSEDESVVETRNYEVSTTHEVFEKTQGEIEHLAASVLLNFKEVRQTGENGQEEITYEPYSAEEVREFKEVLTLALGIQPERGDELAIKQVRFYEPVSDYTEYTYWSQPTLRNDLIRWGLVVLAFLAIVGLIYSIKKRIDNRETQLMLGFSNNEGRAVSSGENANVQLEGMADEEQEEFLQHQLTGHELKQLEQKTHVLEEIKDFVEIKPSEAAQVMRAMMTTSNDES